MTQNKSSELVFNENKDMMRTFTKKVHLLEICYINLRRTFISKKIDTTFSQER